MTQPSLSEYAIRVVGEPDADLRQMIEEAIAAGIPTIHAKEELSSLLTWLAVALKPRRVLEIGTLFGYSSVLLARSLPRDSRIVTLEAAEKHAELAQRNFQRAGVADRVDLRRGPALQTLRQLEPGFDLIFIDANKDDYPEYLAWTLRLAHPGTVIVADNVWFHGEILESQDPQARGIRQFNEEVAGNPRLQTFIFSYGDGRDAASVSFVKES